jgi:hypothetical protein
LEANGSSLPALSVLSTETDLLLPQLSSQSGSDGNKTAIDIQKMREKTKLIKIMMMTMF